jgi:hypothetical protein
MKSLYLFGIHRFIFCEYPLKLSACMGSGGFGEIFWVEILTNSSKTQLDSTD